MDDIDWLIISEVYKKKNVTKAARTLYISQPTITKKIRKLEERFNIIIYERKSKGIEFTPEGEYLAIRAGEISKEMDQVKKDVKSMSSETVGKLNIGVSNHIAKYKLPEVLSEFHKLYPMVEFNIFSGYGREVHQMMNTQNIHVGLIRADYEWGGSKEKLGEDQVCLVYKHPISMEDLPELVNIDYQTGSTTNSMIESWWESNFDSPRNIGMHVDNLEGCKEMVMNGFGYGILPESIVTDQDQLYKSRLMLDDDTPLVASSWIYYTESLLENKIISEFVEFVKHKFEEEKA
ncbi:LysR family transcriptional regulator [Salinicoccus sp. ID82-1]|uniref:LysR family transcriptional regulator n=1 Tax=Salinicoccus sp. ID82-1 TaxID=2820269 RepID=UPI001F3B4FBE|nr:LysR family transcriptional regulator [Salinicoccus sp. ID82-1]MCG1009652.1 LysR family transcriptional regulator [Salinicoccus sp. ID82-1]